MADVNDEIRDRNLPGKVSRRELRELRDRPEAAQFKTLAMYIRHKLEMSTDVRPGAPKGSRRNPAGRRGKGDKS